jgi:hypothetical protein
LDQVLFVYLARARAYDGSWSRWGAPAEQGEAGSGHGRRPLPCQSRVRIGRYCPCVGRLIKQQASSPCLVLSYTRHWLGERSPLGRAAALLAGYPPPTTSTMDLQCGADRHPSSPFALSGSSVGQRGIFGL